MADKPSYGRASDHVKGIGEGLEKVANTDMLLHSFEISKRSMRGEDKTFVGMQLSTVSDPDNKVLFHAWSDSLADKLRDLPAERSDEDEVSTFILAEPLLIKFGKVATSGGFKVWSFE